LLDLMLEWLREYWQPWWYHIWREITRTIFHSFYGYERFGLNNLPQEGPCLLIANHQSFFDPPLVGDCYEHRAFYPVAKAELFRVPIFGPAIARLNTIPIDKDRVGTRAIKEIISRLESGNPVLIFPEGSRTLDGRIQPFERGVGVILRRVRVPVVPVAIHGAYEAWPRSRAYPHLFGHHIRVLFGKPIMPGFLPDDPDEAVSLIESRVRELYKTLEAQPVQS
jgi:1-acyl-sn-glycerol-3-phosphate acyltransferase